MNNRCIKFYENDITLLQKEKKLILKRVTATGVMEEVRDTEELRSRLDEMIIKNNFNLITPDVVSLSQMLDKEIVKEQKKKAALQSNLKKKFTINIIARESEVV